MRKVCSSSFALLALFPKTASGPGSISAFNNAGTEKPCIYLHIFSTHDKSLWFNWWREKYSLPHGQCPHLVSISSARDCIRRKCLNWEPLLQNVFISCGEDRIRRTCLNWVHLLAGMADWPAQHICMQLTIPHGRRATHLHRDGLYIHIGRPIQQVCILGLCWRPIREAQYICMQLTIPLCRWEGPSS